MTSNSTPFGFITPRVRTYLLQLLLAFAAGAVSITAFAPFGWGLVLLITLALLFHLLWQAESIGRAIGLGYVFGLGLMGFGVSWIHNSIIQFGGVSPSMAIFATAFFVLVAALYYALFAGILKLLGHNTGKLIFTLWLAPLAWVFVEWLRSWLLTGFPWLSIGYSQIDLPLAGYAPILGVLGVSIMLALSAALITVARNFWPVVLVAVLWIGGGLLQQIDWT